MTPHPRKSKVTIARRERDELLVAMLAGAPELAFTPRGDPDPRLVRLARLLGRQLARQTFEAQRTNRSSDGSR